MEPLSGSGGRALHNGNGGGPDPDSPYSAPDSCGVPAEARSIRQQYRTSARPSQDASDRELFYTLPRNLTVSRKEILRRRSVKDEVERHLGSAEREQARRPTTLPSIGRRARLQEADTVERASSLLKKVSRQDILRRRASVETSPQLRDVTRTSFTDLQNPSSRSAKDRDLSRPSTLPKTLHASRTPRLEEYVSSRTRETAGREAPIYGRIRRRKMSLPTGAATLRDPASSSNTLTRFSRTRTSGERAETTTKVIRHLRDPIPDPLDRSRYSGDAGGEDIYAKVARKVTRQVTSQSREEKQPEPLNDRTMSRRRIISNANQDSLERRIHQDRDQDVVRIRHDAILVSKSDMERMRNFKAGKNDLEKTSSRVDSTDWSTRRDARTDSSWSSRDKCLRKDSTWTNERQARCRPKSQSSLLTQGQIESVKPTIRPTTLPSYVKLGRKTSTGSAARDVDEQKRASNSGLLTKQSKERSNYVKKTATRIPIHVRALSDANSARSNSPETSSSIFGFCTGKRKVQASPMTRSFPSWNLKTVRYCHLGNDLKNRAKISSFCYLLNEFILYLQRDTYSTYI